MSGVISQKISRTCDSCKVRKVRCIRSNNGNSSPCDNCTARNIPCHFSYLKQPRKRKLELDAGLNEEPHRPSVLPKINETPSIRLSQTPCEPAHAIASQRGTSLPSVSNPNNGQTNDHPLPQLYIDLLLSDRRAPTAHGNDTSSNKLTEMFGHSSNVSLFSNSRIRSLNSRLGHTKLNQLMQLIDSVLSSRLNKSPSQMTQLYNLRQRNRAPPAIPRTLTASYIRSFFEQVHPVYPFLDRRLFEKRAFEPSSQSPARVDEVWLALYYTVLAIGCQYDDGGSFDRACGPAWKLFEIGLSYFPDIIMMKGSLVAVQGLTAMAIFSANISAYQFESLLVVEVAKMCQSLGYNKTTSNIPNANENERRRTFWVVYCLEKTSCFITGRTSIIMDSDIGCPIPYVPESIFGGYDWFLSLARYSRLVSRICSSLFSVSSGEITTGSTYHGSIHQLSKELEAWQLSIPEKYRPGERFSGRGLPGTLEMFIAVTTQYLYFNALLTLLRISLYAGAGNVAPAPAPDQQETKKKLMRTACLILDLTKYIEVETYTSLWVLALMPMSALFILFDLVVHNPTHPETNNNLALLDVASGHFGRLEYISGGILPGSLVSEFAHIAREYVRDVQRGGINRNDNGTQSNSMTSSVPLGHTNAVILNENSSEPNMPPTLSSSSSQGQKPSSPSHRPGVSQTKTTAKFQPSMPLGPSPEQQKQRLQDQQAPATDPAKQSPLAMQNEPVRTDLSTESIFFPLVDDPTYLLSGNEEEMQQLLGIDVMDLFDFTNTSAGGFDRSCIG